MAGVTGDMVLWQGLLPTSGGNVATGGIDQEPVWPQGWGKKLQVG